MNCDPFIRFKNECTYNRVYLKVKVLNIMEELLESSIKLFCIGNRFCVIVESSLFIPVYCLVQV